MKYGNGWFLLAVCGFIGIWHKYDPAALDSLASIGWSYDDGSALADFTNSVMGIAFISISRRLFSRRIESGEKRLASEAMFDGCSAIHRFNGS